MQSAPPRGRHDRAPSVEAHGYAFGAFLVDPVRRLLWRDGVVVPLSGKTFDLLLALLAHRDRVVDKDALLSLVWPDAVVQENNLVRHISSLRRALGQRLDQHDPIVTVSGRGYRFVAAVTELTELPKDLPSSPAGHRVSERRPGDETAGAPEIPAVLPPPQSRWQWRLSTSTVVGLTIVSTAVVVAAVLFNRSSPHAESRSRALRQFTYEAGLQQGPTWSPDGSRIAYSSDSGGNSDIWVQSVSDPTPVRLTSSPAADYQPAWSPDGRWIAFRSERDGGGIFVVAAAGGDPRRLSPIGFAPRWSADSSRVLFDSLAVRGPQSTPFVIDLNGGAARRVRPDLLNGAAVVAVSWAPGGRVSILSRDRGRWQFRTAPLDAGAAISSEIPDRVAEQLAGVTVRRFAWSPTGTMLFFEGESARVNNIWRVRVHPQTLAWLDAERVTTGASQDADVTVSADGRTLAFSAQSETTRLWAFPFDMASAKVSGEGRPVTSGGAGEYDVAATTDGSKLAYRTLRADRQELWEHSIDGGRDRLLLASSEWSMSSPRWSRDATRLAYQRARRNPTIEGAQFDRDAERAVAILSVQGATEHLVSIPNRMEFVPDDWSPDGSTILGACSNATTRRMSICLMSGVPSSTRGDVRLIASDPNRTLICLRFSPNQRWISFIAADRQQGKSTIYVMPSSGGPWTAVTDGAWYDDKPRWSIDGRTLLFISNRGGLLNLWGLRFDPEAGRPIGEPFRVTAFDDLQRSLPLSLGQIEIAVASTRVFLPVRETTGKIWILDGVDK